MGFLTEDLLEEIKIRSMAPISQETFTDERILRLASSENNHYVVPMIMDNREDFFLTYTDYTITAGQKEYYLPERAVGNSLKSIMMIDDNGRERILERVELKFLDTFSETGTPTHFLVLGDKLSLYPTPSRTEFTLRLYYFRRQSALVKTSSVAKITVVTPDQPSDLIHFTVDTDLTAVLSAGESVDFQSAKSPFHLHKADLVIDTITATEIRVLQAGVSNNASAVLPVVGDYITPAQETNVPQLPAEFHPILAQRTALKMLEALGDRKKWELVMADLKLMEKGVEKLIMNRVAGQPKKIKARNSILGAIGGRGL